MYFLSVMLLRRTYSRELGAPRGLREARLDVADGYAGAKAVLRSFAYTLPTYCTSAQALKP